MIKRRENNFSLQYILKTFLQKKNQRTKELIEKPLILGTIWNWDED